MQTQSIRYKRRPEVLEQTGLSNSTLCKRISQGLFVPPVSLGARAVGWLGHEVDQVLLAIAAGKRTEEVKAVVHDLVQQRKSLRSAEVGHG